MSNNSTDNSMQCDNEKEPLHAILLNWLNSILQITIAWHVYMIADSIIAGIISFLVLLLRDANCISSKYLAINKDYRINDKLLDEIAQSEMPNIAFFNSLMFIVVRMTYVFL